jgi:hypothetical protein
MTVEVTALEGVDLDAAPPCDAWIVGWFSGWRRCPERRCRRASTHRVRAVCPVHGPALRFLCARHVRLLKWRTGACRTCGRDGVVSGVRFGGHA